MGVVLVSRTPLPRDRRLECILDHGQAQAIALSQCCECRGISRPGLLQELGSGEVLGQLEIVDAPFDRQVLARLHEALPSDVRRCA